MQSNVESIGKNIEYSICPELLHHEYKMVLHGKK